MIRITIRIMIRIKMRTRKFLNGFFTTAIDGAGQFYEFCWYLKKMRRILMNFLDVVHNLAGKNIPFRCCSGSRSGTRNLVTEFLPVWD